VGLILWKNLPENGKTMPQFFPRLKYLAHQAVFIDNVTEGSTKKRQRQLGANGPKTEYASRILL
jgi:hypothetical protein